MTRIRRGASEFGIVSHCARRSRSGHVPHLRFAPGSAGGYETLCSETDDELRRIHDFLEVGPEELSPEAERRKRHTIAGNKVRFDELDIVREDLGWKGNLRPSQLDAIRRQAGDVASQLGYEL